MKKIFSAFLLLLFAGITFAQGDSGYICRYGFTFEISVKKNWGYGKPVVLSILPNTSAHAGGLLVNDIIESINGKSTQGHTSDEIFVWLQNSEAEHVELEVSNLKERNRLLSLNRYCNFSNALTEKDLAEVYAFYSLEDIHTRKFSCPFKIQENPDIQLLDYKTFAFPEVDEANEELEQIINFSIKKSLEGKGLVESIVNPDLIIHTYYSYSRNPNYNPSGNIEKLPAETRYNMQTQSWETLPIYFNPLIHPNQAQFLLKLGIRFIVPEKSFGDNMYVIWETEADELLQSAYSLSNYAQFHIPLMLMNYPYTRTNENPSYYYNKTHYNYTGINFNMDNMKEIIDVEFSSPAAAAGIQAGDVIEKINGIKFENNPQTADNKYKQFILKTTPLRDTKTQFTNAEGFTRCMYWNKINYAQIYDEFQKPEFSTAFSYLFYFEPYINLSETNMISFEIKRGRTKETVRVTPVIVRQETFELR